MFRPPPVGGVAGRPRAGSRYPAEVQCARHFRASFCLPLFAVHRAAAGGTLTGVHFGIHDMTQPEPTKSMTKSQLIAELAAQASMSKAAIGRILDGLAAVAYREARNGFVIPGICKLGVAHRRARRARNPKTGQTLLIRAHDAVTVKAVKKARDLIAPAPEGLVTIGEEPAPALGPRPASEANASVPLGVEEFWFQCPHCRVEIASSSASAGERGICPSCSGAIIIPAQAGGVAKAAPGGVDAAEPPAVKAREDVGAFVLFRCPECGQEIEAPCAIAGQSGECPSCGILLMVPRQSAEGIERAAGTAAVRKDKESDPKAKLSRTIRIDLDDVFA